MHPWELNPASLAYETEPASPPAVRRFVRESNPFQPLDRGPAMPIASRSIVYSLGNQLFPDRGSSTARGIENVGPDVYLQEYVVDPRERMTGIEPADITLAT